MKKLDRNRSVSGIAAGHRHLRRSHTLGPLCSRVALSMSSVARRLHKSRNSPPEGMPWVWLTREMIESQAWTSLSRAARLVVDRVMIEHMAHAGSENGRLVVTYSDFVKFGIRRASLKSAITEAAAKGFILVVEKGRPSTGPERWPAKYALGWLPLFDAAAALNKWKAWTKPSSGTPIPGNIESSIGTGTREDRRNPRPLVSKVLLDSSTENGTSTLAEIASSPVAKSGSGKMDLAEATALQDADARPFEPSQIIPFPELPAFLDRRAKT